MLDLYTNSIHILHESKSQLAEEQIEITVGRALDTQRMKNKKKINTERAEETKMCFVPSIKKRWNRYETCSALNLINIYAFQTSFHSIRAPSIPKIVRIAHKKNTRHEDKQRAVKQERSRARSFTIKREKIERNEHQTCF